MGEIADMMIEGLLDSETGELIDGEAPGYPRTLQRFSCPYCQRKLKSEQGVRDHIRDKHADRDQADRAS